MPNHGECDLEMVNEDTEDSACVGTTFNITTVTRPLHSTSKMCDAGNDVLMTKKYAVVVPEGTVEKILRMGTQVRARYPRRGGLYVAKMRTRAAGRPRTQPRAPAKAAGFT